MESSTNSGGVVCDPAVFSSSELCVRYVEEMDDGELTVTYVEKKTNETGPKADEDDDDPMPFDW